MEHPDFTERDRQRLSQLQKIADEMLVEALKDSRLKRWEQLLMVFGGSAFLCIFLLPGGRGVTNWANYLFFVLGGGAAVLFFCVLRWKSQIQDRVEQEFLGRYGVEYKKLAARRDAAEKEETGNMWR